MDKGKCMNRIQSGILYLLLSVITFPGLSGAKIKRNVNSGSQMNEYLKVNPEAAVHVANWINWLRNPSMRKRLGARYYGDKNIPPIAKILGVTTHVAQTQSSARRTDIRFMRKVLSELDHLLLQILGINPNLDATKMMNLDRASDRAIELAQTILFSKEKRILKKLNGEKAPALTYFTPPTYEIQKGVDEQDEDRPLSSILSYGTK